MHRNKRINEEICKYLISFVVAICVAYARAFNFHESMGEQKYNDFSEQ